MASQFYNLLGVPRTASGVELRRSFRQKALETHPDKGGTSASFRAVVLAFETLSDPATRALYDQELVISNSNDGLCHGTSASSATAPCSTATTPSPPPPPMAQRRATSSRPTKRARARSPPQAPEQAGLHQARPAEKPSGTEQDGPEHKARLLLKQLRTEEEENWDGILDPVSLAVLQELLDLLEALQNSHRNTQSDKSGKHEREEQSENANEHASTVDKMEDEDINMHVDESCLLFLCDGEADTSMGTEKRCTWNEQHDIGLCSETRASVKGIDGAIPQKTARSSTHFCGVHKHNSGYIAVCMFEHMRICSLTIPSLEGAIDFHMMLSRLRHLVAASKRVGVDFPSALKAAVNHAQTERTVVDAAPPQMRYDSRIRIGNLVFRAPTAQDLDTALSFWLELQKIKSHHNPAEFGRQCCEALYARIAHQRQERRAEHIHLAEQRREERKISRMVRSVSKKVRTKNQQDLKQQRRQQKELHQRWGVFVLPAGIEEDIPQAGESIHLYATLELQDGSLLRGPPRRSLQTAVAELAEFKALQASQGEGALCSEVERREVEAMTSFFMNIIASH